MGTLNVEARTCPTCTCRVEVVKYFSEEHRIEEKIIIVITHISAASIQHAMKINTFE